MKKRADEVADLNLVFETTWFEQEFMMTLLESYKVEK